MKQRWSTKALSELDGIRDYTRSAWGSAQARIYLRAIREAVGGAARAPMQAAPADLYRPGYRKITVGQHLVLFRISDDAIEIVRIIYGAMDIEPKLD